MLEHSTTLAAVAVCHPKHLRILNTMVDWTLKRLTLTQLKMVCRYDVNSAGAKVTYDVNITSGSNSLASWQVNLVF
ncbi:hypothetical protein SUGI_0129070 [Cryptomeria japonica]|nr:hypothetical protein SUGI_0129070 [Cryptomeria japonica]